MSYHAGNIYTWGLGKEYSLGNESLHNHFIPKQITKGNYFIHVFCGNYYTIGLSYNNELLVFGKNTDNRLGINNNQDSIIKPTKIKLSFIIKYISCGNAHCLVLTNNNIIYGWGKGKNGQLGNKYCINNSIQENIIPIEVDFNVSNIFCGNDCSFLLSNNYELYSFGSNNNMQLGRITDSIINNPNPIKINNLPEIEYVSCGISYICCISINKQLYTWGSNKKGELGLGKQYKCQNIPKQIKYFRNMNIIDISCGKSNTHQHTLAIIKDNNEIKVYAWGDSYKNQLGINNTCTDKCFSIPTEIEFFRGKNVSKVISGGIHSIALCNNKIYTWGCGSDGRLGHNECQGHRYLYKESKPRLIKSKLKVIDISCSYYHCACIAIKQE